VKQAKNFLEKGHRVKVTVIFWGRKFSDRKHFMKDAEQRLKVFESLGKVVSPVKMNGSNYSMILESKKKKE